MDLAVDVGLGHMVQVDQRQLTDTAARQRFRRPGADPANANDSHMRRAYARCARNAVEAIQPAEAALEIGGLVEVGHPGACA
jgi:hypothetical protein